MLVLRSTLFNILFYATLLGLMLLGLPTLAFGRHGVLKMANIWARSSLFLLRIVCGTRVEIRGQVPARACIVASKHQSFFEIIALSALFEDFTFVFKRELTRIPLFGWYLARSRQISIDRGQGRSALALVSRRAREVLAEGRFFIIFPEGTRRPVGAPPEYKSGAAFIYADTGATLVPVAVNSGVFWPRRSFLRHPGTLVIEFLAPIPPGLDRSDVQALLADRIEAASRALVAEAFEADPGLASLVRGLAARTG